jgi:hypothetical protein
MTDGLADKWHSSADNFWIVPADSGAAHIAGPLLIVNQALHRPEMPAAIRDAIGSRILALSRSHELLTSGNCEGADCPR